MNIPFDNSVVKTHNKLHKLPLGSITARGWLKDQLERSKHGTGGHLDELEPDMIATPFINYSAFKKLPFEQTPADPTFAAGWSSEISGCYWTGLVQLAFTLNDPELIAKATRWVDGVLTHQEPDGYLGGYPPHTDRMQDFNAWSAAWCYRALLSYYEATGMQTVLDAVHRGLLWFCRAWKDHKTDYVGAIITEPMVIVYSYTGDQQLIDFCADWLNWLEDNSLWQNKVSQYLSDRLPYASMHTVAYGEDLKHPALLYCANGDERLLKASLNAARKALERLVQTTGGASSCQEYLSPKGAACETEYCNFATFSHTYSWLAMITGHASWGDEIERIIFNGAQGARKKDERAIAYMSAPNMVHANSRSSLYGSRPEMDVYSPCFNTACCTVQAVRIFPEFIRGMCLADEDGQLCLFCYGPAAIHAPNMDFEIDTLYPFRDTVHLKITRAENQSLRLRIPCWCNAPTATVGGATYPLMADEDGFALLPVLLNTGDTVTLHLPMEIKMSRVDDSAAASKFPISIERGPLVYALPVQEKWRAIPGAPITPLPEGWSWFVVNPDLSFANGAHPYTAYNTASWSKAIDENVDVSRIRVVEYDTDGYVWENPPVTLQVPMYQAPRAYICVGQHTHESWEVPLQTEGPETMCTMVPHGCTNLRITYLPRAAK